MGNNDLGARQGRLREVKDWDCGMGLGSQRVEVFEGEYEVWA